MTVRGDSSQPGRRYEVEKLGRANPEQQPGAIQLGVQPLIHFPGKRCRSYCILKRGGCALFQRCQTEKGKLCHPENLSRGEKEAILHTQYQPETEAKGPGPGRRACGPLGPLGHSADPSNRERARQARPPCSLLTAPSAPLCGVCRVTGNC